MRFSWIGSGRNRIRCDKARRWYTLDSFKSNKVNFSNGRPIAFTWTYSLDSLTGFVPSDGFFYSSFAKLSFLQTSVTHFTQLFIFAASCPSTTFTRSALLMARNNHLPSATDKSKIIISIYSSKPSKCWIITLYFVLACHWCFWSRIRTALNCPLCPLVRSTLLSTTLQPQIHLLTISPTRSITSTFCFCLKFKAWFKPLS